MIVSRRTPLLLLLAIPSLVFAGCTATKDADTAESAVHGSVGVRYGSRDTSRFAPERTPF